LSFPSFAAQPCAIAEQADHSQDDELEFVPNRRRGELLHRELERQLGSPGPCGGSGTVWRPATGREIHLKTPPLAGVAPARSGYLIDDRTLVLSAPADDPVARLRLIDALIHHNVGLLVDLSSGQTWHRRPPPLPLGRKEGAHGHSTAIQRVERQQFEQFVLLDPRDLVLDADTPACAVRDEASLMLQSPASSRGEPCRPRHHTLEQLRIIKPLADDIVPARDTLALARYCIHFRKRYPGESIAFLCTDGLGPALALAGAERFLTQWHNGELRRAGLDDVVIDQARQLRDACGPLALRASELSTLADFVEYIQCGDGQRDDHRPDVT